MLSALTSWGVVGTAFAILIGLGISLTLGLGGTSMSFPYQSTLARLSFSFGFFIFLVRASWWLAFEQPPRDSWLQPIIGAVIIFGSIGALWIVSMKGVSELEYKYRVTVSPLELTVRSPMNKHFILSVKNNQNDAIYNVNLGICLNCRTSDFSWIKIEPTEKEKEFMPGIPVSMCGMSLTNGCLGIVFSGIDAHKTKDFYITIEGKKLNIGSKVAFRIYNWYSEPYFESIPVSKDSPQNFQELITDKSGKTSEPGHVYAMRMKKPTNPFFEEKEDPKDYWVAAFISPSPSCDREQSPP